MKALIKTVWEILCDADWDIEGVDRRASDCVYVADCYNLEEIVEFSKREPFEGKIYFSENYVRLMEGLALTLKDASIFLDKLNKKP